MSEHRVGVNPGFLTKHKLALSGLDESRARAICSEIEELMSIDGVWADARKQTVTIAYDASHHDIDEMIAIIEKHGARVRNNWWTQTRLGFQRQTDQNIKDNAHHEASCCSKMPTDYKTLKK